MKIVGPERYRLTLTPTTFSVTCEKHTSRFSGIATSLNPKLYIVSIDNKPVYVGVTKQKVADRLRQGFKAAGKNGYYGYSWRRKMTQANIDIWCQTDAENRDCRDMETMEAEIAFLVRLSGQWPQFQTEIHFYPSTAAHRQIAKKIFARYVI